MPVYYIDSNTLKVSRI